MARSYGYNAHNFVRAGDLPMRETNVKRTNTKSQGQPTELRLTTRAVAKRKACQENDIAKYKKQRQLSMAFPFGPTPLVHELTQSQTRGHLRVDVDGEVEEINPSEPRYCLQ